MRKNQDIASMRLIRILVLFVITFTAFANNTVFANDRRSKKLKSLGINRPLVILG
jgi:hypothetical protein